MTTDLDAEVNTDAAWRRTFDKQARVIARNGESILLFVHQKKPKSPPAARFNAEKNVMEKTPVEQEIKHRPDADKGRRTSCFSINCSIVISHSFYLSSDRRPSGSISKLTSSCRKADSAKNIGANTGTSSRRNR